MSEEVGKEVVFLQSANKDSDHALTTAFEFQEARCQLLLRVVDVNSQVVQKKQQFWGKAWLSQLKVVANTV